MSSLHIEMIEHPKFLEFIIQGTPSEQDWVELVHRIPEEVQRTGKNRILANLQAVEPPVPSMVRYRIGILTGEKFGVDIRVAALGRDSEMDHFWETVATNRGALAKSGHNREELIRWLLENA